MKSVHRREEGATFARPWRHFDFVARGEPIALLAGGKALAAPEDAFIVLPNDRTGTGDVWFYLGTETVFPA